MRRARIKPVANLAATRRSANKSSSDPVTPAKENESDSTSLDDSSAVVQSSHVKTADPTCPDRLVAVSEVELQSQQKICKKEENPSEELLEVKPALDDESINKPIACREQSNSSINEASTFKTPLQLPRAENESSAASTSQSSSNKFRRFKVAPRLNTSRNVPKIQVSKASINKHCEINDFDYFRSRMMQSRSHSRSIQSSLLKSKNQSYTSHLQLRLAPAPTRRAMSPTCRYS